MPAHTHHLGRLLPALAEAMYEPDARRVYKLSTEEPRPETVKMYNGHA